MSYDNYLASADHTEVVYLVQAMGALIAHKKASAKVGSKWRKKKKKKGGK